MGASYIKNVYFIRLFIHIQNMGPFKSGYILDHSPIHAHTCTHAHTRQTDGHTCTHKADRPTHMHTQGRPTDTHAHTRQTDRHTCTQKADRPTHMHTCTN